MSDKTKEPTPDQIYNKKVFVITTTCVALYVGAVVLFVL
jgi:hypothetical protein